MEFMTRWPEINRRDKVNSDYPSFIRPPDKATAEKWETTYKKRRGSVLIHIDRMSTGKGFIAQGCSSFRDYSLKFLPEYSYSYVCKMRRATELHRLVEGTVAIGHIPEAVLRELGKVANKDRLRVWNAAKARFGDPTQIQARQIVETIVAVGAAKKTQKSRSSNCMDQQPIIGRLALRLKEAALKVLAEINPPPKNQLRAGFAQAHKEVSDILYTAQKK